MYLIKTPHFLQTLFPNFIWRLPTEQKKLYLTFDDGPIPEVTPWVLDTLKNYDAKATFFCVGHNIHKYPDVFERLKNEGHTIGNHSYNHLSGWTTDNIAYFHNVRYCAGLAETKYFRPPYGKIKPTQAQFLQKHYKIIMWDVLSGDFDPEISAEQCFQNVIRNADKGSIVVFHDNLKSFEKLQYSLPKILANFADRGFTFHSIQL